METVRVESLNNLRHVATTPRHSLVVDDSHYGGDELGPNPYELLLSALGA